MCNRVFSVVLLSQVAPVPVSTGQHLGASSIPDDRLWDLFNAACRGERGVRPPEMDLGLSCQLLHYGDPYLRLGPFRLEPKNRAPFVAVFRDFMYEAETDAYREAAAARLERSKHYDKTGVGEKASVKRTSSQVGSNLCRLLCTVYNDLRT